MRLVTETTESPTQTEYALGALSDADLLDAWSRDQHRPALAELVRRYSVMVLSVCRRRCRSVADADDAFQTTFLYLARNSQKIRRPERLAGWLQRVAQRAAVASLKSAKRETEPMVETPDKPDCPLDRLTQRHEAIVLDEELSDLPEHYRTALVMHIYDGHPLQAMADHFGTSIGSIRGRLQRGKQMLARRLRHRGVVPVLALAAAHAWTASAAGAAAASESFWETTSGSPSLPDPPIESSLLESLLAQGVRLMPSLYTSAGIVAGTALLAIALTSNQETTSGGETDGQTAAGPPTIALPAAEVVGQFGGGAGGPGVQMGKLGDGGAGLAGGAGAPDRSSLVWKNQPTLPQPTSAVARRAEESLQTEADFAIHGSFIELPEKISQVAGVPVLVDDRAIEFAEVQWTQEVNFERTKLPLRTALREILHPHGLKVVVADEGLLITADPATLVHRGIGTSRWINVDEDAAKMIDKQLQEVAEFSFQDMPLSEALEIISQQHPLPVVLDTRALEEIGLTPDQTVSIQLRGVKLRSALRLLLSDLDLTYTIQGESLVVTTPEAEENQLLQRIYWLESTGIATGDFDALTELIKSTIAPDTWDDMGGPSTMSPTGSVRPAMLISTTYEIHRSIDNLLKTLRETHFGVDPVLERVQVPGPADPPQGGGGFF
jgi:RNA polymerase sigma factor (sigma-70 family)